MTFKRLAALFGAFTIGGGIGAGLIYAHNKGWDFSKFFSTND